MLVKGATEYTFRVTSTTAGCVSGEREGSRAEKGWNSPEATPDSKVYGANMGPTRGRQDPGGPHVGPMNLAIWDSMSIYKLSKILAMSMLFNENACLCPLNEM